MEKLRQIASEITKGKNIDTNLVKFGKSLDTLYNGLAFIKLSMNYYTLAEMIADDSLDKCKSTDKFNSICSQVNSLIVKACNNESFDLELLDNLRNQIIEEMELVTGVVDVLRIYEYVLNRIEYRFDEKEFDISYYNDGLTNDLMHYILADKDSVVVNGKISEIVAQLPMRLTKNKFFEHLYDAFTLMKGAQKQSLKDFVYSVSTTAMLSDFTHFAEEFANISEMVDNLKAADYREADKAEFTRLQGILNIACRQMELFADYYCLLAMNINDLYTIGIATSNAFDDVEEVVTAKQILLKTIKAMDEGVEPMDDEVMDLFASLEGKQERIVASIDTCDSVIEYCVDNYADNLKLLELSKDYEGLSKIVKLQSGSTFIALNDVIDNTSEVDIEEIDAAYNELVAKMKDSFSGQPQIINRAVMASVLGSLPVFFNSVDEIQGYINASLSACNDAAEQKACVEIMKMIMNA